MVDRLTSSSVVIAIDGYSSCGKSTLAKQLADKLGYIYIDSGAMYRAVTLYFLDNNIDVKDHQAVQNALDNITITFSNINQLNTTFLNDIDVEEKIRSLAVSQFVSEVSVLSDVRKKLVALQRVLSGQQSVVMDGRDIGTVVFPNADIKLFLTANYEVRAKRRYEELKAKQHQDINFEEILENLKHRDAIDTSRADSPLRKAHDAILIDNTHLTIEGQFELAMQYIQDKLQTKNSI